MKSTITLHCITCAREFTIPREEYDKDEFRLYCPDCAASGSVTETEFYEENQ